MKQADKTNGPKNIEAMQQVVIQQDYNFFKVDAHQLRYVRKQIQKYGRKQKALLLRSKTVLCHAVENYEIPIKSTKTNKTYNFNN